MNDEQYKKMLLYFKDMKQHCSVCLGELAELADDEQADRADECKMMDYALCKVVRYGSDRDLAEALKLYVPYVVAAKMVSLPR